MLTNFDVKIDVLNDEEAWQLFCQKAGDVSNDEKIKPLAEAIAKECCGLPLAIIVVGAAMRGKEKVELWEHDLKELRRSVPSIENIEVEVYKPLRWSYDSLQGNNIKSCFLYCSLFPEDYPIYIPELVQCWLAEGLIDEQQNYVDIVNTGMDLIEKLKDSCLLEDSYGEHVKMHDVVRDVAIWIASSSEDGCKSLVRSGIGLTEISVGEFSNSNSLKRVSFMMNNITMLPDCVIQCSEASKSITANDKAVTIRNVNISQESIGQLCAIAESLILSDCKGLDGKIIDLGINSICHGLKSFKLSSMILNRSSRPNGGLAAHCDLLPNLEKLYLRNQGLESISELLGYPGLRFLRLKSVYVDRCFNMKYLFSSGDFIRTLPNLEVICVA